jgi:hypothetical protein
LDKLNKVEPLPASDITGELCPKHNIQKQTLPHPSTLVAIPSLQRPIAQPTDVGTFPSTFDPFVSTDSNPYQTISLPGSKMPKHQTVSIGSHSSPLFILWLNKMLKCVGKYICLRDLIGQEW